MRLGVVTNPRGVRSEFAWDWQGDGVAPGSRVIVRARGWSGLQHTAFVYDRTPVVLGE